MRFRTAHKTMSYLLVATAVATLATAGVIPPLTLTLLGAAAIASWFSEPGNWLGRLVARIDLLFTLAALGFLGLSMVDVVRTWPDPDFTRLLNFSLFLLASKLFQRRSNRDYLHAYILSFLLIIASSWASQTIFFIAGFAAYVVLATWTLILFHLRREIEDNYLVKHVQEQVTEKAMAERVLNSRRVVGRPFFLTTGALALGVLAGAGVVFAAIPRVGIGFLTGGVRRRTNIVGFSDRVQLGHHGALTSDNQTVVFRATVPSVETIANDEQRAQTVANLYWRGTVYDTYRNGAWVRAHREGTETILRPVDLPDGARVSFVYSHEMSPAERRRLRGQIENAVEHEIQAVGLSDPVAFAIDRPIAYRRLPPQRGALITTEVFGRWGGEVFLRSVRIDPSGAVVSVPGFSGARYVAYSIDPMTGATPDAVVPLSPETRATLLAVPPSLSPRVHELARRITAGKATTGAKVNAVVGWLKDTHTYSLELKRDESIPDPLEDFLFQQTSGHCEYFASAAAILLRLGGVPTRYVNGFLGGEWNDIGGHITVRDNRAHSWVEAYYDGFGWSRVDATPAAASSARMSRLREILDSMEAFWSWWILDYDTSRQYAIARRIGGGLGLEGSRGGVRFLRKIDGRTVVAILLAAGFAIAAARLWRRRRDRAGRNPGRTFGDEPVARLYQRALAVLERLGLARAPAETPREFATRVARSAPEHGALLARLTEPYAAARYGQRPFDAARLGDLAAILHDLDRLPPPAGPPPTDAASGAAAG